MSRGVYRGPQRNVLSLVADIADDWFDCKWCSQWAVIINHNGVADTAGTWFVEGSHDADDLDEAHRFSNASLDWWRTAAGVLVFGGSPTFAGNEDATLYINIENPLPFMRVAWVGTSTGLPQGETFQSARGAK